MIPLKEKSPLSFQSQPGWEVRLPRDPSADKHTQLETRHIAAAGGLYLPCELVYPLSCFPNEISEEPNSALQTPQKSSYRMALLPCKLHVVGETCLVSWFTHCCFQKERIKLPGKSSGDEEGPEMMNMFTIHIGLEHWRTETKAKHHQNCLMANFIFLFLSFLLSLSPSSPFS